MKIDTINANDAVLAIIKDTSGKVFLDANIFIPPDRTKLGAKRAIEFGFYRETILAPLFDNWSGLAIHESVFEELVEGEVKSFADEMNNRIPSKLEIHYNSGLSENEKNLYNTNVDKLSQYSDYQPDIDNSDDRGEILSLSYMAVKEYIYFSANDHLPISLITRAVELETGLDYMNVIQMYEIIYVLFKLGLSDNEKLRKLYKYMYYSTNRDKKDNPCWSDFIDAMNSIYKDIFAK